MGKIVIFGYYLRMVKFFNIKSVKYNVLIICFLFLLEYVSVYWFV